MRRRVSFFCDAGGNTQGGGTDGSKAWEQRQRGGAAGAEAEAGSGAAGADRQATTEGGVVNTRERVEACRRACVGLELPADVQEAALTRVVLAARAAVAQHGVAVSYLGRALDGIRAQEKARA